ncbi:MULTISPECIES: dynamin family protein [Thalassospira]|jgi:transcriptional regulator with XRE-family HTH domain|uniref:dynamin family protein n=2 Tax=Thalassospira TaxID=168934 RepID=UPI000915F808|nr:MULTISPECIES: dynamin family protein [Thalassospira]MDM7975866.1 dynamin family protein [Thalassospira xiamenensis]OHY99970.1 hypothetical protein BC440_19245 [Thalassospira sp. MIT1004]|tara:strand:- start:1353 stop:3518 length:2166 start_codon:yes stop_codon:yes gene_type:complete
MMDGEVINLFNIRNSAGLSQGELAEKLGISQSAVSRFEQDQDNVPLSIYLAWIKVCGQTSSKIPVEYGNPYDSLTTQIQLMSRYAQSAPNRLDEAKFYDAPNPDVLIAQARAIGRKPRLAFCGRFDQGKSRLANTLMGGDYLHTGYQPVTSMLYLIRHINDRPTWFKEDVWIMKKGFDLNLADDQEHCFKHRLVAGSFDTLRDYGTHRENPKKDVEKCSVALVYIDTPFLLGCDLIDLPGYGNSQDDHNNAEIAHSIADILVYVSTAQGFLDQNDLHYISALLEQLPPVQQENDSASTLQNMYFLATWAHQAPKEVAEIIRKSSGRAFKHLFEALEKRAASMGRQAPTLDEFRERFFSYLVEQPSRREGFEGDLSELLGSTFPNYVYSRMDNWVLDLKTSAKSYCSDWLKKLTDALEHREAAQSDLLKLESAEPERQKRIQGQIKRIHSVIDLSKRATRDYVTTELASLITAKNIEDVICKRYEDRKEAQELAGTYLIDHVKGKFHEVLNIRSRELAAEVNEVLATYSSTELGVGKIALPFNAQGVFLGALASVGTYGALSAWVAAVTAGSNLGGYLLVPSVVSFLSSIGISVGGTATAVSFVASIGGPITIMVGLGLLAGLAGYALFGASWQRRLAKKIAKELSQRDFIGALVRQSDEFWEETRSGFDEGIKETESAYKSRLKSLRSLVNETDPKELSRMIGSLDEMRDFFGGIPWRKTI